MNWIMTSIFREYMKLASDNSSSVRTSLYLDNEYKQAINLFTNPNKEDLLDIDSVSKIGE